jgi:acyl carrier protein
MIDRATLLDILRDVCPDLDFERETSLIDDGLLESLDIVSIVTGIIDEFDVEINVDDLLPENFNSVDDMIALIESKL